MCGLHVRVARAMQAAKGRLLMRSDILRPPLEAGVPDLIPELYAQLSMQQLHRDRDMEERLRVVGQAGKQALVSGRLYSMRIG